MSSKKIYYEQMKEFNRKVFEQKLKYRKKLASLPFEEKIKIIDELYTLAEEFKCKGKRRHKGKRKHFPALQDLQ